MIKAQLLRDDGLLVVSPEDKLESIDFERLQFLAEPYGGCRKSLNPGWSSL